MKTELLDLRARIGPALLFVLSTACGSDTTELVILNEQGSGSADTLSITQVLIRSCLTRYWSPNDPPLDATRDRPEEGAVSIAHDASHAFELSPGCHDFVVTRTQGTLARARVLLEAGESALWVPFLIDENESWWCYTDDCE